MIKLQDAELISVLPSYVKDDIDVQSISYAFKMAMSKMLEFAQISSLYGNIDRLPEEILDLLAIELQSQYYDEAMDINVKRNIIKNSIAWYAKGGTVSAVQEMIATIFGEGEVVEWFDFENDPGIPGMFDIITNREMSPDMIKQFNNVIKYVKNSKSHLRTLKVVREIKQSLHIATIGIITRKYKVERSEA